MKLWTSRLSSSWMNEISGHQMLMDDLFPKHRSEWEREIRSVLLGGTKLWTSRLALHGWTRYHNTCYWWMISFQNTVKRESERELHSNTFCTTRFPLHEWMKLWWHLLLMDDIFPKHKSEWSSLCTFEEWKYVLADDLFMDEWNCGWMISLFQEWNSLHSGITHERKIGYCKGESYGRDASGKIIY
jgi:uncharacterized protein YozE (UPF0346 family)